MRVLRGRLSIVGVLLSLVVLSMDLIVLVPDHCLSFYFA